WKETRLFSGVVAIQPASGALELRLSSPTSEARQNGGPFLEDDDLGFRLDQDADHDSVLPLVIDNGALTWKFNQAKLRLEPVREDGRAALIAEANGDYPRLAEATRAGTVYTGTT